MREYSDSSLGQTARELTLAVDGGSPLTSVALGAGGRCVAATSRGGGAPSRPLISEIESLLSQASVRPRDLGRLVASRGPGSFTGLRVSLATVLGLRDALGVPAVGLPAFPALARQGDPRRTIVAAVDALRDEWFVQLYPAGGQDDPAPPRLADADWIALQAPCQVVTFSADKIREHLPAAVEVLAAEPLAPGLLALAEDPSLAWDPTSLTRPLYLRPPLAAKARAAPQPGL